MLGMRLPGPPPASATTAGALAPDLATLLVLAASPHRDDVFLDPFAGSGALVIARAAWPYRELICADVERPAVSRVARLRVLAEDARTLPSVADHSVNMIVTDPPWYEFEEGVDDFDDFMRATLTSLVRVLVSHGGRLVILMSRRRAPSVSRLWKEADLALRTEIPILVNGHPASVLIGGTR
jgi:tRNA G10  N-methylase Trm11